MAGILKVDKYQDFNGNDIMTSDGSGNITINNAALKMTPAFHAYLSTDQTGVSGGAATKVQIDTEVLDTDSNYDNTTNYRFTPTTAGKYFIYGNISAEFDTDKLLWIRTQIRKNGTTISSTDSLFADNTISRLHAYASTIVDMNGSSDYVEIYCYINRYAGGSTTGIFHGSSERESYFGGYKIIE